MATEKAPKKSNGRLMKPLRPQVLILGIGILVVAAVALKLGQNEVAAGAMGGLIGIATKLAEKD